MPFEKKQEASIVYGMQLEVLAEHTRFLVE
jgi:hypothetical protein